ncbi:MAG: glucokinase [Chitinophagaceae bacterium]|nr:MAG: glucokinase [Chitinophagaceae bacterium]
MPVFNDSFSIPVSLPGKSTLPLNGLKILAGDIGGTKTNLALFHATRNKLELIDETRYSSTEYDSVKFMIRDFLDRPGGVEPDRICLGVAGPVIDGKAELTNLHWEIDSDELMKMFKVENVSMINDLEAVAYGLSNLGAEELMIIREGNPLARGNMAILAPGTGLGQAGLFWDGKYYHPFPTEGGHCDFSPRTEEDFRLTRFLQKLYGIVSWEKLVSGPAIFDIYKFLDQSRAGGAPEWLLEGLKNEDPSVVISQAAEEESDEVCIHTMELFVRYLARESSNLVLKMKATGGLFLGGGIPPKISVLLERYNFFDHFMDCDRMQNLLEEVPLYLIKDDKTGLNGAASFGAYGIH